MSIDIKLCRSTLTLTLLEIAPSNGVTPTTHTQFTVNEWWVAISFALSQKEYGMVRNDPGVTATITTTTTKNSAAVNRTVLIGGATAYLGRFSWRNVANETWACDCPCTQPCQSTRHMMILLRGMLAGTG